MRALTLRLSQNTLFYAQLALFYVGHRRLKTRLHTFSTLRKVFRFHPR
jgi:hypothetical protein